MYVRLGLYSQVRVCYHDREQHLRRDYHSRQGIAGREARYGHQGGGQRQAGQGLVS